MPRTVAAAAQTLSLADALRKLGEGKDTDTARVLVQTAPLDEFLSDLSSLWKQEDKRRQKRSKLLRSSALLPIGSFVASGVLLYLGRNEPNDQQHFRFWAQVLIPCTSLLILPMYALSISLANGFPRQAGIIRALHLRPHWQLVPLMIEALPITFRAAAQESEPKMFHEQHRALLTTFLPLWCAEDTGDLTPKQRRILLGELKSVAFEGIGAKRSFGLPASSLSGADLDFCVAVLNALDRAPARTSGDRHDHRTRRILEHLPAPAHANDPNRRYLQEAAQEVLTRHKA